MPLPSAVSWDLMGSPHGTIPDQCAQVAERGREGVGGSESMPAAEGAIGWGKGEVRNGPQSGPLVFTVNERGW